MIKSSINHEPVPQFEVLTEAFQKKTWYCGTETNETPIYFGDPTELSNKQLEQCRLYPRLKRGDFPHSISSALIGMWTTIGAIQGRYSQNRDFSFRKTLLSPIVLKYPEDFQTNQEFTHFTEEFYSGISTMDAHGGKMGEWERTTFDPSLDKISLTHQSLPVINMESAWWHERRHSRLINEAGYPDDNFYYLGLDLLTRSGASTRITKDSAYNNVPSNISPENHLKTLIVPFFPSGSDWKEALSISKENTLVEFKAKPWFHLISQEFRENITHLSSERISTIGGLIGFQILRPDIFGNNFIDYDRLKEYRVNVPESARYRGYFPPRYKHTTLNL